MNISGLKIGDKVNKWKDYLDELSLEVWIVDNLWEHPNCQSGWLVEVHNEKDPSRKISGYDTAWFVKVR
jgi:hypothetical protein